MTGRRLYDHFTDARAAKQRRAWDTASRSYVDLPAPKAWPFLAGVDRDMWNDLARRITPKRAVR